MNTQTDTKLVPINLLDAVIDNNIHMPVDALPSTAHAVHTAILLPLRPSHK